MKSCHTCRQSYSDDVEFCPRDGARLAAQATETEVQFAAGLSRRYRMVRRVGGSGKVGNSSVRSGLIALVVVTAVTLAAGYWPGAVWSAGLEAMTEPEQKAAPSQADTQVSSKPHPPQRIRVSAREEAARLILPVPRPEYPPHYDSPPLRGIVRLDAVIGKDGKVEKLKPISGKPLLTKVAMETVRNWRYRPRQLNGEAVEVATEIDINFTVAD
jgi:hypothetical protein